jgi:hypothetical protein
MSAVVLLDKSNGSFEAGTPLIFTLLVVKTALRIGKDIATAVRRAKKNPSSLLADDGDIFVQSTRPAAGIEHRSRAILQGAKQRVFPVDCHCRRRRRSNFFLQRSAKDKPVGGQVILPGYIGK